MLKRIVPKEEEVTGLRMILHNSELHKWYSSPDVHEIMKSRSVARARHATRMEEMRNAYKILVVKPGCKRSAGKSKRRWNGSYKSRMCKYGL
jgi:hypothetical protein